MDRRTFIEVFAGGLVIARSIDEAQPAAKVYRIGFLSIGPAESAAALFGALSKELRDLGFVEARNVVLERRYADGRLDRLPELAAELVRLPVDVIVGASNPVIAAAKRATATIPIVMVTAVDPVGAGFITSLARPGGNITGGTADNQRAECAGSLPACRTLCREDSRRGQARRITGGAAHEVRAGHQSENRQGTRPHHPAAGVAARG
jgi:ABC-type uncharacterized transport system substrate-binding protein